MSHERRTYTLSVVVEPEDEMWHAYCPTLLTYGAATWGTTREEALAHIHAVVDMLVRRMAEDGMPIPTIPVDQELAVGEQIVVTVCVPILDTLPPA